MLLLLFWPSLLACLSFDTLPSAPVLCGDGMDAHLCLASTSHRLLESLKAHAVTVATAESLTAGLMASSLVDVPLFGAFVYGGAVVYNSDAKRQLLGVTVPDVYSRECAGEMAVGVISSTRANVGVAVTGNAGPVAKSKLAMLGVVDWAVAVRLASRHVRGYEAEPKIFAGRVHVCGEDGSEATRALCGEYIREAELDPNGMVNVTVLTQTRNAIRVDTATLALNATAIALAALFSGPAPAAPANLSSAVYDGLYVPCGEPSAVLKRYLPPIKSESTTCSITPIPWPQATATSVRGGPHPGRFSAAEFSLGMVCGALLVMAILMLLAQRKARTLLFRGSDDADSNSFQEPLRPIPSSRPSTATRPLLNTGNNTRYSALYDSLDLTEKRKGAQQQV
jgi:PncC family amidohydrolase